MKQFLILWFGQLIANIGSGMTAFAIAVYVFQQTDSVTYVSIATLLAFLPTILLNPIGGILADRFDRRLLMICGDLFSVFGLVVILISLQLGYSGVMWIMIGVAISSIFLSLLEPAYKATVTDLLSEEQYSKASGLVQMAGASKYLISPILAGFILFLSDIRVILIIDIATIIVTVIAVAFVRKSIKVVKRQKEQFQFFTEFKEGMRSISSDKCVMQLVILMTFICFFIAFIQTLMSPMILTIANEKTLGMMMSVSAIGMLVGSIIIGIITIKKKFTTILFISLMAAGIFMAMTGVSTNLLFIVISCFLFFITLPFINMSADVLLRMRIRNEVQGRAWGMISVITQLGYVVAYAICGVLADYVFIPMLVENGMLAGTIGKLIGTGESRGIGLMLIISGLIMFSFAFIFARRKSIKEMEVMITDEIVTH